MKSLTKETLKQKLKDAHNSLNEKWLNNIVELLNETGVPEYVEVGEDYGNSPDLRLKWYILRRKNVSKKEI